MGAAEVPTVDVREVPVVVRGDAVLVPAAGVLLTALVDDAVVVPLAVLVFTGEPDAVVGAVEVRREEATGARFLSSSDTDGCDRWVVVEAPVAGRLTVDVAVPATRVGGFAVPEVAVPVLVEEDAVGLVADDVVPVVVRRAVELAAPATGRLATGFVSEVPLAEAGAAAAAGAGVGEDRGSEGALGCDTTSTASTSDMVANDSDGYCVVKRVISALIALGSQQQEARSQC